MAFKNIPFICDTFSFKPESCILWGNIHHMIGRGREIYGILHTDENNFTDLQTPTKERGWYDI